MAVLLEQRIDLKGVDETAKQVRDLALGVPRLVVLQAPRVALQQQRGRPRMLDLLGNAQLARHQVARQPLLLPVEHHARAGLVDVGALSEQPRVLVHLCAPSPAHQHHLDVRPHARLDRSHPLDRHAPLAVSQQRRAPSEQGAVEVHIHTPCPRAGKTVVGAFAVAMHVEGLHRPLLSQAVSLTRTIEPWSALLDEARVVQKVVQLRLWPN